MKLILTSFGIETTKFRKQAGPYSLTGVRGVREDGEDFFYRMPPVSLHTLNNNFVPDYATLLLCDSVVMDTVSFEMLMAQTNPPSLYLDFANTLRLLHAEGYVELLDFESILERNRALLDSMVENDLKRATKWIAPLTQSLGLWREMIQSMTSQNAPLDEHTRNILQITAHGTLTPITATYGYIEWYRELSKSERTEKSALVLDRISSFVRSYLAHVNSNIIISGELGLGFHDWADFYPFYKRKFSPNQKILKTQPRIDALTSLFDVSFPEFAITDPKLFLKILRDKRIVQLRTLVEEVALGKTVFDEKFALSVFKEVFRLEKKAQHYRRIISFLTLPLDLIPGIGTYIAKGVEEVAGEVVERRIKEDFRWFYMLSDHTQK